MFDEDVFQKIIKINLSRGDILAVYLQVGISPPKEPTGFKFITPRQSYELTTSIGGGTNPFTKDMISTKDAWMTQPVYRQSNPDQITVASMFFLNINKFKKTAIHKLVIPPIQGEVTDTSEDQIEWFIQPFAGFIEYIWTYHTGVGDDSAFILGLIAADGQEIISDVIIETIIDITGISYKHLVLTRKANPPGGGYTVITNVSDPPPNPGNASVTFVRLIPGVTTHTPFTMTWAVKLWTFKRPRKNFPLTASDAPLWSDANAASIKEYNDTWVSNHVGKTITIQISRPELLLKTAIG